MWDRNRSVAGFDRTHNFQMYGVYTLPFGKGQRFATNGLAGQIIGNWQVNGVFSKYSGTPFTVGSAATSLNASNRKWRFSAESVAGIPTSTPTRSLR